METVKCSEVMRTCKYSCIYAGVAQFCDYIGKTGCRRGCDAEHCDKYEKKRKSRRR